MKSGSTTTVASINQYTQNMQNIQSNQRTALEYIFNFIEHLDLSTDHVEAQSSVNNKQTVMTPYEAAIKLQRAIRYKQIADISALQANHFFSANNRQAYLSMFNPQQADTENQETKTLAEIMYGKTIAAVTIGKIADFPAEKYKGWNFGEYLGDEQRYHRDDQIIGELFDNIIRHYEPNPNKDEMYIPFITVKNASIDDLINNYFSKDEKKVIKKIYTENNTSIGMMALCSVNDEPKQMERLLLTIDRYNLIQKIRSAGLLPSPWEIAQFNAKLKLRNSSNITTNQPNNICIDKTVLAKLPNSVQALKRSELMIGLSKIVTSNSPCKLLAACLHRMISALPDNINHNEIIQRLVLFLSLGVNNYHNNYERFAFIVYAVTHEISLFIKHALNHNIRKRKGVKIKRGQDKSLVRFVCLKAPANLTRG